MPNRCRILLQDPLFVYIEDMNGVTNMNREQLGQTVRDLLYHAQRYYRGSSVENKTYGKPNQDVSLKGQVWQLYNKD